MFIATANNLATIPGPLRDRMEIIQLLVIRSWKKFKSRRDHLLPKQLEEHGLTKGQFANS